MWGSEIVFIPVLILTFFSIFIILLFALGRITFDRQTLFLVILFAILIRLLLMPFFCVDDLPLFIKTTNQMCIGNPFDIYKVHFIDYQPQYLGYQNDPNAIWKSNVSYPPLFFFFSLPFVWLTIHLAPTMSSLALSSKMPSFIADFLCAFLLYKIVNERWGSQRAGMTLAIWLLCPLTIFSTAVFGHFESLILVFILLMYRHLNNWLKASLFFSLALLTKQSVFVFLFPLIFLSLTKYTWRQKFLFLLIIGAIFLSIVAPFYLTTPEAVKNAFVYSFRDRPPAVFTPWVFFYPAKVLRYNGYIILLAVALVTFLMRREKDIIRVFIAVNLAVLISSKVLSSHYYIVLILLYLLTDSRLTALIISFLSLNIIWEFINPALWNTYWGPIHLFSLITMINFFFLVILLVLVIVPRYEKKLFERVSV